MIFHLIRIVRYVVLLNFQSYMLHIRGIGHCQKAADFEKNKPPKPKKQKKKEKSPAKTKSEVEMERVKSQAEEKKKQETSSQWYCSCCDKKMTSDLVSVSGTARVVTRI